MSALLGRAPAPAGAGAPVTVTAGESAEPAVAATADSLVMRLVAFAALAGFGAAHWATLVESPSTGRTLLVVLVATGGAAALGLVGRAPLPRAGVLTLAALIGFVTLLLGLMAAGLPGRLLLPAHWSELARRARSRARRGGGRRVALRRAGAVDPPDGPAGGARTPRDRRAARLLARPPRRHRAACRGAGHAAPALWKRRRRARPRPAGAARAPAPHARGRVAVASAPAAPGGGDRGRGRGERGHPVGSRRHGPGRREPLVGLPRLEPVRRRRGDQVRLDPLLRATRLVARRRDDHERQVGPAALLEGRDARHVRRPPLGTLHRSRRHPLRHAGGVHGGAGRGPLGLLRVQPRLGRADPLHRPLALERVRHRGGCGPGRRRR